MDCHAFGRRWESGDPSRVVGCERAARRPKRKGDSMSRAFRRLGLAVTLVCLAIAPGRAMAQVGRGASAAYPGSSANAPASPGLYANPYTNPYSNPFMNPYMAPFTQGGPRD